MKITPLLSFAGFVLFGITSALDAAPRQSQREYRPLAAKSVRIVTAGEVKAPETSAAGHIREGWRLFDAGKWKEAADRFLSGLEADPREGAAAEGLVMSLFRAGEHAEAAAVANELAEAMPGVKKMVAGAAYEEVRKLVDAGQVAEATVFVSRFPSGDPAYRPARELAGGATAVETALKEGSGNSGDSPRLAGN